MSNIGETATCRYYGSTFCPWKSGHGEDLLHVENTHDCRAFPTDGESGFQNPKVSTVRIRARERSDGACNAVPAWNDAVTLEKSGNCNRQGDTLGA